MATFPGGMLVMGRKTDDSQSFIIRYSPNLELEVSKGSWEFASIGWMGANPLEGIQQCSYQRVEIGSDIFTVNFNMNYQACLQASTLDGQRFVDPMFYNQMNGTLNGFKKLTVKTCANIDTNCSTQTPPASFRVEMRTDLKGLKLISGALNPFGSNCISDASGGVSNITPPHGGKNGFIGMKISIFSDQNCTNFVSSYHFDHGFGEVLDRTFYENGANVQRRAALSVDVNSADASIAQTPFAGVHSDPQNAPAVTIGTKALFVYGNSTSNMTLSSPSVFLGTTFGDYLYFDGTSTASGWSRFTPTISVKLLLQN